MSGYISRSKLIKDVENLKDCYNGFSDTYDKACIIGLIAEQPSIEEPQKPKWIPVTERLPEEYKDVLCYYEYFRYGDYNCMFRTIDRGYYGNGRWGGEAGQGHKNKVLAWMPLPEPPDQIGEATEIVEKESEP